MIRDFLEAAATGVATVLIAVVLTIGIVWALTVIGAHSQCAQLKALGYSDIKIVYGVCFVKHRGKYEDCGAVLRNLDVVGEAS